MASQPPPGKGPDLAILIGHGKPRGDNGGPMPPPGSDTDPDADQDQDQQGGAPKIRPEWVDFHTGDETCQNCEYMQGSNCTVLNMPVGPNDHCEAFEPHGGAGPSGAPGMMSDSDAMGGGA